MIGVTVAQHAPAPMMPMAPTTASSDVHTDARSAITVTPAVAAPGLHDANAGTHAYIRAAAEVRSSANDRAPAAAPLDHSTVTAAAAALETRAASAATALDGCWWAATAAATALDGCWWAATAATALDGCWWTAAATAPAVTAVTTALASAAPAGMRGRAALRQHNTGIRPMGHTGRQRRRTCMRRRHRWQRERQQARACQI